MRNTGVHLFLLVFQHITADIASLIAFYDCVDIKSNERSDVCRDMLKDERLQNRKIRTLHPQNTDAQ